MPYQQLERLARGKILNAKGDHAIDDSPFEPPGAPVKNEFDRNKEDSQEKI
jgi:hypothetical protein